MINFDSLGVVCFTATLQHSRTQLISGVVLNLRSVVFAVVRRYLGEVLRVLAFGGCGLTIPRPFALIGGSSVQTLIIFI